MEVKILLLAAVLLLVVRRERSRVGQKVPNRPVKLPNPLKLRLKRLTSASHTR